MSLVVSLISKNVYKEITCKIIISPPAVGPNLGEVRKKQDLQDEI